MLDAEEIIILASVAMIVYVLIAEVYKLAKNKDWVLLVILVMIIALIIWFIYHSWTEAHKDKTKDDQDLENEDKPGVIDPPRAGDPDPESEQQKPTVYIPEDFQELKTKFEFGLPSEEPDSKEITYEKFKEIYLTPGFLEKFTDSLKLSLSLKKKLYLALKTQLNQELKAFGSKNNDKPTLADLLSSSRNEMAHSIKGAVTQSTEIIQDIEKRLKTVNIEQCRKDLIRALSDPKNGLESLSGREEIKDFLALKLYTFAMNPRTFFTKFQNIALYAGSGYGKTKIAQVIGHVYSSSGILIKGHFIQTTTAGLVSPYVNETAHKTRSVLLSTLESVLFIDEAYDITPPPSVHGKGIDHGHQAITEMVNFIDKMIGMNVIIVAGYEEEMEERFMKSNQGLERRFLPPIVLKTYNAKQLTLILIRFLQETNPDLVINQEHCNYIYSAIKWILDSGDGEEIFKRQAGDILNLSGDISGAIYGTHYIWPKDYRMIIRNGFNKFLSPKGISLGEISPK